MSTVSSVRQANLELLIRSVGTMDRLAELADTSSVYLSQLRNRAVDSATGRPRAMGDKMARRLERACGKPEGWMDSPHSSDLSHYPSAPTSATALEVRESTSGDPVEELAEMLRQLPRTSRGEVAQRLAALALAPDSAELVADLQASLRAVGAVRYSGKRRSA